MIGATAQYRERLVLSLLVSLVCLVVATVALLVAVVCCTIFVVGSLTLPDVVFTDFRLVA